MLECSLVEFLVEPLDERPAKVVRQVSGRLFFFCFPIEEEWNTRWGTEQKKKRSRGTEACVKVRREGGGTTSANPRSRLGSIELREGESAED